METKETEGNGEMPSSLDYDQKAIVDFTLGRRAPDTQYERELYNDIQEILRKGYMVELPFD